MGSGAKPQLSTILVNFKRMPSFRLGSASAFCQKCVRDGRNVTHSTETGFGEGFTYVVQLNMLLDPFSAPQSMLKEVRGYGERYRLPAPPAGSPQCIL